jgi:dynein heavy chain
VVARQTIRKLGVNYMKLGDKEVEHNPDFQLYLHTKLSNPHYPPEIQAETTLVNFAVTEAGLEDQMLAIVVRRERPDLEARKGALIKQQNEFKIKLKELEDDLLQRLATAEGDLTENLPLIENLEESKRLAAEIQEKVRVARETEVKINAAREAYRPVANRAALMFFLLAELRKVNAFYEYSLSAFVDVFERGIANTPGGRRKRDSSAARGRANSDDDDDGDGDDGGDGQPPPSSSEESDDDEDRPLEEGELPLDERILALIEHTTYAVFQYTRRSLFDRHRLIFASQVCLAIEERSGNLDPKELSFLVKGEQVFGTRPDRERLQRFLPEPVWAALTALTECENFAKFQVEISKNADAWEKWTGEEMPELVDLPKDAKGPVRTPFQKLCVIRAMRPDRMTSALRDWVRGTLGDKYVDEEPFVLRDIYEETSKTTPMMFILFPGAQPVKDVEALAREQSARLITISMGQGQEPAAEAALDDLSANGGWIFLDNVHLMSSWLPVLERKLEAIAESGHPDFRFFFSAEPGGNALVSAVPESILQASIKLVNEPPSDLKANLRRAFAQFSQATFDRSTKQDQFKPCLFALCFFHSLVLGRRKFGAIGWSRHYSFNMGDLTICADVLMNYLDRSPTVPWDDLRYMFGEIMYGGHITDHWDRRTNNTYLEVILRPELFAGMELAPSFRVPDAAGDYELYKAHIEHQLPAKENPVMFGLHSNAEINFLTEEGTQLFSTIQDLQGAGGEGGLDSDRVVLQSIDRMLEELPVEFDMLELNERIEEKSPFIVILLQETTRANGLLFEIRRSLTEAKLGLTGQLNVSEAMEHCTSAVFLGRIPPTWVPVSYPSTKSLAAWMVDLRARIAQLAVWCEALEKPSPVVLPYLFNPQAFLTAVQQVTSRRQGYPLDFVGIQTDVTPYYTAEELAQIPAPEDDADVDDGVFISGLYLQGCAWDTEERILTDSRLKELFVPLPVLKVTAKLREDIVVKERYICPVYSTTMRGPTYVFEAQLPSDREQSEWVIAGAAVIMSLPG